MEQLDNWKPDYTKIVLRLQKWVRLDLFIAHQNFGLKVAA